MTEIGEVKDDFKHFKNNDFLHLCQDVKKDREEVNKKFSKLMKVFIGILVSLILLLIGVIVNLATGS